MGLQPGRSNTLFQRKCYWPACSFFQRSWKFVLLSETFWFLNFATKINKQKNHLKEPKAYIWAYYIMKPAVSDFLQISYIENCTIFSNIVKLLNEQNDHLKLNNWFFSYLCPKLFIGLMLFWGNNFQLQVSPGLWV